MSYGYNGNDEQGEFMRKLLISLVLGSIILAGFSACTSKPKPEAAVKVFLEAFKKGDETFDYDKMFDSEITFLDDVPLTNDDETPVEIQTRAEELLLNFEYEVVKAVVAEGGNTAVVTVKFTTVNMGDIFYKFFTTYITKAMEALFGGATEEEVTAMATDLFLEASKDAKIDKLSTVDIEMIFKDKVWLIKGGETNKIMFDALLGGMITVIEDMQETQTPQAY
ncbi:MAG: putative lipoprotein [Erysipelotrichaceae bacterium]|nr:MAG: hypothetical protein FD179_1809 [Erysipelotrichaceae bacterium]TXT18854.1 MAG: putative lipoprotein [Erysipelotrichaceae bacterium]